MTLKKLSKYPSNRHRGGSFFTMVIFIMLLISTALMYYYFQRTRFLERQVIALQNGEQPEPSGISHFVSWIKGTQPSDSENINASAEPPKSTPRPQAAPIATPEIESDTLPESVEFAPSTATSTEPSLVPLAEEATESFETATPDEDNGLSENADGSENITESAAQDDDNNPAANQPINSLYDTQQPPPVRVRSPQRR